ASPPPRSPRFPYTTLFRSGVHHVDHVAVYLFSVQRAGRQPEAVAYSAAGHRTGLCPARPAARRYDHGDHTLAAQRQATLEDPPPHALHEKTAGPAAGLVGLPQTTRTAPAGAGTLRQMGY